MRKPKCIGQLILTVFFLCTAIISCTPSGETTMNKEQGYFEGEISLVESVNFAAIALHTHFFISENKIKREQKFPYIPALLNTTVGMIADLEQDSVCLYYNALSSGKKCTVSIKEYLDFVENYDGSLKPSPIDQTFTEFTNYRTVKEVKDSTTMRGFSVDYSKHLLGEGDSLDLEVVQEVFDTKGLIIKRELLELAFPKIPDFINFPLASNFGIKVDQIENDSIIQNDLVKGVDALVRQLLPVEDTLVKQERTDFEALSDNKLLNVGLDVVKKGLNVASGRHVKVLKITPKRLAPESATMELPQGDYETVIGVSVFFAALFAISGDFDD